MNLSVFTHGFYITINSVMHIISIVDVWRQNSHVFLSIRSGDGNGGGECTIKWDGSVLWSGEEWGVYVWSWEY